jgi:hypothetical protein
MDRKAKEEDVQDALLLDAKADIEERISEGFFDRLTDRVLDNLTIYISRIHMRYEDDFTSPGRPFAVGTSLRVVLGDERRLRPLWEVSYPRNHRVTTAGVPLERWDLYHLATFLIWQVPLERLARVELKKDHVMLWTWEKVGFAMPSYSYNVVVERIVHCTNALVLEAMFNRLHSVARQVITHESYVVMTHDS